MNMKKTIIAIMMLACFCMAGGLPSEYYFEGKTYMCEEDYIIVPELPKLPKCSNVSKGDCADYDAKGNEIHAKLANGREWWNEYDAKGNLIHWKSNSGAEWYWKYDTEGNKILSKDNRGTKFWNEFDAKGNRIHTKSNFGKEWWYEYNAKGYIIHTKDSQGHEWWYKWFFDKKNNKQYGCHVDQNGNPKLKSR